MAIVIGTGLPSFSPSLFSRSYNSSVRSQAGNKSQKKPEYMFFALISSDTRCAASKPEILIATMITPRLMILALVWCCTRLWQECKGGVATYAMA